MIVYGAALLGENNLLMHHLVAVLYTILMLVVNWRYLMNDGELKDIVAFRGWFAGFRSIFLSDGSRQSLLQAIHDERRGKAANGQQSPERTVTPPPSSKNATKIKSKKRDTQLNKNAWSFDDEKCLSFKKFYRRSSINTMLTDYEANPMQFEIHLKKFVELEQACKWKQYPFNDDYFIAAFNAFKIHSRGRCVQPNKHDSNKAVNVAKPLVTLEVQSLLQSINYDTKIVLQNMLDNVDNEESFDALFQLLLDKQRTHEMQTDRSRESGVEHANKNLRKRRTAKDKHSRLKKSKIKHKRHERSAIMLIYESSKKSAVSKDKMFSDSIIPHDEIIEKAVMCNANESGPCTSDVVNEYCELNVPNSHPDV